MDKGLLQRYVDRVEPETSNVLELDPAEDLGCFGWLRGLRERAPMLELRKRGGNRLAIAYGWIDRVEFDPSEGITLWFSGQRVHVKGRNLTVEVRPTVRLFEGLVRHRVPWIQETAQPDAMLADEAACVIESLTWDPAR